MMVVGEGMENNYLLHLGEKCFLLILPARPRSYSLQESYYCYSYLPCSGTRVVKNILWE